MTIEQAQELQVGDLLKCKHDYILAFFKDLIYTVHRIEDCFGDIMVTVKHNDVVVTWPLKHFELVLFFDLE